MSDIINKLPTGSDFKAKSGSNSLQSKMRYADKMGGLGELRASQEAIIKLAQKRQEVIRKGQYTKSQVDSDLRSIANRGNLSNQGKRDLRAMLTHLSTSKPANSDNNKAKSPSKAEKKRAELHPEPFNNSPLDFLNKPSGSINQSNTRTYDDSGSGGGISAGLSSVSGTSASAASAGSYKPPALKV